MMGREQIGKREGKESGKKGEGEVIGSEHVGGLDQLLDILALAVGVPHDHVGVVGGAPQQVGTEDNGQVVQGHLRLFLCVAWRSGGADQQGDKAT